MICPRNVYKKQRAKKPQTNKGPYLVILSQLETSIASSKGPSKEIYGKVKVERNEMFSWKTASVKRVWADALD